MGRMPDVCSAANRKTHQDEQRHMAKLYTRTAPKSRERKEKQRHNGVPQLAAEIAGVSVWMAYKVMYGQAQSRKVNRALAIARQRLGQGQAA